jgi:PKD repeat protein
MKKKLCFITLISCLISLISACAKPTEACFDFSPSVSISPITTVTFDASCTKNGGTPYKWNFGDGTVDTTVMGDPIVTHTFNTTGTFTVRLEARRKDGVVLFENNKYITERTVVVQ